MRWILVPALVLAVFLTGCPSKSDPQEPTPTPEPQRATVNVRAFLAEESGAKGEAAVGAAVLVNGSEIATTSSDGAATLEVSPGQNSIEVRAYPTSAGKIDLQARAGGTYNVEIILDEGKELAESTVLHLDEAKAGVMSMNATTFTLRFVHDGQFVPLADLETIDLMAPSGGTPRDLMAQFKLSVEGSIVAKNNASLMSVLYVLKRNEIRVFGTDAKGRPHAGTVKFQIGRFRVQGKLKAPPSFPGLTVAGVRVRFKILNSDTEYEVLTDESGAFGISELVPAGNLEFYSEVGAGGKYYYGQGAVAITRNVMLEITMRHTEDIANGVEGVKVTQLSPSPSPQEEELPLAPRVGPSRSSRMLAQFTPPSQVSVSAGRLDVEVLRSATFIASKGTKTVHLKYIVSTDEYPEYVLEQSIYDDFWSIAVRAGSSGQQIYFIRRQVNEQLWREPAWQMNASTGEISISLDVAELAADQDVTLTLIASAANIGDGLRPTHVNASLSVDVVVSIDTVTPDIVEPTLGDSRFYSIPRPGVLNTYQRYFTLKITKPEAATVRRVTVRRFSPNEETILDEGLGEDVELLDQQTVRVLVTHRAMASVLASAPPPSHQNRYQFVLIVEHEGHDVASKPKESGDARALWRMPDGFGRYSTRDDGGDDWCSRGTYRWLEANRADITRINDISGEHARDIGHNTHQFGTDIDMFHFYTFPGATSGADNYQRLRADVLLATRQGNPSAAAARERIIAWVQATRAGLDTLGASYLVSELLHVRGSAGNGLTATWAQELLQTGSTSVNGVALDFALGAWHNDKYRARSDHNDHVHITLNRLAMGE